MLVGAAGFLIQQADNISSSPFDFQHGNSSHVLLSCGEAFPKFFPEMVHITKFILCLFLILILLWPVQPVVQFIVMLPSASAPFTYFVELACKASGIGVDCGSFNLPLVWFATLCGFGLSLICVFVILLMVYFSWRYRQERGREVKEVMIGADGLAEALGG